jgi:pRiA4b ORF-3-like protein
VVVPGNLTLARLHLVIQGAMGWQNYHLHLFEIGDRQFGPVGDDLAKALVRPRTVRQRELREWIGDEWSPEAFDVEAAGRLVARHGPRPGRGHGAGAGQGARA